jgi:hypothetical protein
MQLEVMVIVIYHDINEIFGWHVNSITIGRMIYWIYHLGFRV